MMRLLLVVAILVLTPRQSPCAEQNPAYRVALLEALAAKDAALDSGKAEDWVSTLDLLRRADAIRAAAITKYEIAFAAAQLGQVEIALENYEAAIMLGLPERASLLARDYIVTHVARVAQLQIEGPTDTVILLNGVERGQLPFSNFLYVAPGPVTIEAAFPNHQRVKRRLELSAGQIAQTVVEADRTTPPIGTSQVDPTPVAEPDQERITRAASLVRREAMKRLAARQRDSVGNRTAWTIAATGVTVTLLSASFLPVAYSRLSSSRDALLRACEMQTEGADTCAYSKQGRWQEAQSASNAIATWKMARTTSWVGLVTGLAASLGGTALLWHSRSAGERPPTSLQLSWGHRELQLSYSQQIW